MREITRERRFLVNKIYLYLSVSRPLQWPKNFLVFAAPLAAGVLPSHLITVIYGFFAFVLASSFSYILNDWKDREADRKHHKKKDRPFASGVLAGKDFFVLVTFYVVSLLLLIQLLNKTFILIITVYVLLTTAYSLKIKQIPVLEMLWLSIGFLIRGLAGSALVQLRPTGWFVTAIFFGALFIVSNKRFAELQNANNIDTRKVNKQYSPNYLSQVSTISATVTLLTYSLWVFEVHPKSLLAQSSILPVTFLLLSYLSKSGNQKAESPEKIILSNPGILIAIILTGAILVSVFYL
jgi:decaprenyl-phosphate phosphoribosyltransferase